MNLGLRLARLEAAFSMGGPCRDAWHASTHPVQLVYPGGDPLNRPLQPPPAGATCPTCGAEERVEVFYVHDWRSVSPLPYITQTKEKTNEYHLPTPLQR